MAEVRGSARVEIQGLGVGVPTAIGDSSVPNDPPEDEDTEDEEE
jgi:hypothetical protein